MLLFRRIIYYYFTGENSKKQIIFSSGRSFTGRNPADEAKIRNIPDKEVC